MAVAEARASAAVATAAFASREDRSAHMERVARVVGEETVARMELVRVGGEAVAEEKLAGRREEGAGGSPPAARTGERRHPQSLAG